MERHIAFVIEETERLRRERWLHPLIAIVLVAGIVWRMEAPIYITIGLASVVALILNAKAEIQLALFRLEHTKLLRDHQELFLEVSSRPRGRS